MELRKAEVQNLMMKITRHLANIIDAKVYGENYTALELTQEFGLPNNRISEIRHHQKYNKPITLATFTKLLESGLLDFDNMLSGVTMNDAERKFLEKYRQFSDKEFQRVVVQITEMGEDPLAILKDYLKKHPK